GSGVDHSRPRRYPRPHRQPGLRCTAVLPLPPLSARPQSAVIFAALWCPWQKGAPTARRGRAMEQWHYDPAADLPRAQVERLRGYPRAPGLVVGGVRSLAAVAVRCWLRAYHRLTIVGRENLP